jgi:hypothetical protein
MDRRWSDLFSRLADAGKDIPRFSIRGGPKYLFYDYDGYSGGHEILDRIIGLLQSYGVDPYTTESDSPSNVSAYETYYDFEDGGLRIYSGNAFFDSKHGAYILGFRALRWITDKLDLPQPRRFKCEIRGTERIFHGEEGERDGLTRVASGEINWEINWEPGFEALRQVLGIVAQFGDPRAIDWNTIIGDHHYFDGIKSAYSMLLCDENDFDPVFDEFHAVRPVSVDSERLYLYL